MRNKQRVLKGRNHESTEECRRNLQYHHRAPRHLGDTNIQGTDRRHMGMEHCDCRPSGDEEFEGGVVWQRWDGPSSTQRIGREYTSTSPLSWLKLLMRRQAEASAMSTSKNSCAHCLPSPDGSRDNSSCTYLPAQQKSVPVPRRWETRTPCIELSCCHILTREYTVYYRK
jgi:hypothetical protein